MFPVEIDIDQVRRQREFGMRGLGQVLKSFRDREVEFPIYDRASGSDAYLRALGPLELPRQGTTAGLGAADPRTILQAAEAPVAADWQRHATDDTAAELLPFRERNTG